MYISGASEKRAQLETRLMYPLCEIHCLMDSIIPHTFKACVTCSLLQDICFYAVLLQITVNMGLKRTEKAGKKLMGKVEKASEV